MEFRTKIKIRESNRKIDHNSEIFTMGSCFAENMEKKLNYFLFKCDSNSHGILFNPASISQSISDLIHCREYNKNDILLYNNKWHSLNHHGKFSHENSSECLTGINKAIEDSSKLLKKSNFLIITLGTAWAYHHIEKDKIAANCHKLPSGKFKKHLLSIDEISDKFNSVLSELRRFNADIQVIFTVSPIRHWKDGPHENQLSKSTLLLSINEIIKENNNIVYFPSYEIMMDELRDYRFYNQDMIHPSTTAIDYIWEKFSEAFMNKEDFPLMLEIEKIQKMRLHRPIDDDPIKKIKLNESIENKIELLCKKYPQIKSDLF